MHEAITTIWNMIGIILILCFVFWCGWRAGRGSALADVIHSAKWNGAEWTIQYKEVLKMLGGCD